MASFEAAMSELRETRGKWDNRVALEVDIRVKSILDELRAGRDKIATIQGTCGNLGMVGQIMEEVVNSV